jgi:hypothetical protein
MSDEFDDAYDGPGLAHRTLPHRAGPGAGTPQVARLVSRVYAVASAPLRARVLACLVRPLGSLGLMAVASGAFARLLRPGGPYDAGLSLDDLGRYSNGQIIELVRFVEQVSPDAIQQVTSLLTDSALGSAAFSAAAALLLIRAVRGRGAGVSGAASAPEQAPAHQA